MVMIPIVALEHATWAAGDGLQSKMAAGAEESGSMNTRPLGRDRTVNESAIRQELERFRRVSAGTVGHFVSSGFLSVEIQPLFRPVHLLGRVLTVSSFPTDNSIVVEAMHRAEPGDVLVIDRQGDLRHACWGGLLSRAAQARGVAGVIIDGPATDWREINELQFPVFCRQLSALTTRKQTLGGTIGEPVPCGGMTVSSGDIVLGDEDGVVVLPRAEARAILEEALVKEEREERFRALLVEGKTLAEARKILDGTSST